VHAERTSRRWPYPPRWGHRRIQGHPTNKTPGGHNNPGVGATNSPGANNPDTRRATPTRRPGGDMATPNSGGIRRNTTRRDRHRRAIARGRPPCHICGEPIDWDADWLDPRSFVVDHKTPLAAGGTDDLANKAPAHRACNRAKGDRVDGGPVLRRSGSLARPKRA